jgi:hypothetical protein
MKRADYYWTCSNLMMTAGSIVGVILSLFDAPRDVAHIGILYTVLLCGWYSPYIALWTLNKRRR